jgi:hypothetical protein
MSAVRSRQIGQVEVERQHGAILQALDKLFELEVPRGSRPALRLVRSLSDAINHDPVGEGLRSFIIRRGWDLWTFGGDLELFGAMRAVMAARPQRQMWNRHLLSTLWADIGMEERNSA